jgi:LuxR family transcriptional regulator, maltose regulon positive regulatory protein
VQPIDELLKQPDTGVLPGKDDSAQAQLPKPRGPSVFRGPTLTAAGLRLLPLLSTHLSFPQIAAEKFLSPNTIKTQAISIYRKLGVSNRSEAVIRARELGLAEGSAQQ